MDFEEIARNIDSYSGQFICHQIGNETEIKTVALKHTSTSTLEEEVIDAIKFECYFN